MPFRCCQIWRKIIQYHEETVYIHVVSYLESRVRVVNARAFEQCRVTFYGRFLVTHVQRQALARDLSAVHIHGEVGQIVMAAMIRVRISRTEKFGFLYHGKYHTFREHTQYRIIDRQCLRTSGKSEGLEFDSRHVISGK